MVLTPNATHRSLEMLGRFFGASTYAFASFRMFGAAVGGTPKGADAVEINPVFAPTMPYSRASLTLHSVALSRVNT